jgi:MFS family permease
MTSYFGELRSHWRPLTAAIIGLSAGLMLTSYVVGIMGPHLIEEFGWSKSQFALIGALALGAVLVFPLVGRLTDLIGVRKTALIGAIASPLLFLALSRIQDIQTYAILFALQASVLATTTPPVYCRIIVQYIKRARGLALAIVASGPAATVAVGGPILNNFVAEHGWRAGYVGLAIFTAAMGLVALLLLPPERADKEEKPRKPKTAKEDYAEIFHAPAFWILFVGMLLCNLPQAMMMTQLNLVLAENGVTGKGASIMISAFATGMLVGRLLSGVALDRFPAHLVTTAGMALSGFGLLILASGFDSPPVLMIAVLLFGLSLGAEGDVIAYLVVRNFGVRIYSTVHGILAATVAVAAVVGALLLSGMLKLFITFAPFLTLTGVLAILGSLLFLLLPRNPVTEESIGDGPAEKSTHDKHESVPATAPA